MFITLTFANASDGRKYRLFNVIDDFKREGLAIEAEFSLPTACVIRTLERLFEWRCKPLAIRCDNGPEFISHAFTAWAKQHRIRIGYIQPGKPQQNAYIERHNRTVRYSWVRSIFLIRLKKFKIMPLNGFGFTIMNGRIKLMAESRH